MQRINVAKVLVRNSDGKYLVLRGSVWPERPDRSQKPDMPGGMVHEGETHMQAAIREVLEETGIHLQESDLDLVYADSSLRDNNTKAVTWLLYMATTDTVPEVKLSWEHEESWWVSTDELLSLEIRQPYPEIFAYLKKTGVLN